MKTLPAPLDQAQSHLFLSPHPTAEPGTQAQPNERGRRERNALATNNRHTNLLPGSKPSKLKFACPPRNKGPMSKFQIGGRLLVNTC